MSDQIWMIGNGVMTLLLLGSSWVLSRASRRYQQERRGLAAEWKALKSEYETQRYERENLEAVCRAFKTECVDLASECKTQAAICNALRTDGERYAEEIKKEQARLSDKIKQTVAVLSVVESQSGGLRPV